ncbi:hypothetical protein ACKGJY_12250 [Hyunsoonleella sp. 2307UL5-6]|uniref:hypothetical protein n=1 Tax=Hyunsoonleella sp. 2307UL5-6 TaxID=3384768 RepID=UPI0039BC3861
MKLKLFFISLFFVQLSTSQSVEITGIVESSGDVENIHVINKTAQKFTITNTSGGFVIPVNLNDTLSFSSVQYESKVIIISEEILNSKKVLVTLDAQINELDKITLTNGLTGNLATDMNTITVVRPSSLHLDEVDMQSLSLDNLALEKQSTSDHYKQTLNSNTRFYQPDIVKVLESVLKVDLSFKSGVLQDRKRVKEKFLLEVYTKTEISNAFNIPIDKVDDFLLFVEKEGFKLSLLEKENEFLLVEFLMNKSGVFNKSDEKK